MTKVVVMIAGLILFELCPLSAGAQTPNDVAGLIAKLQGKDADARQAAAQALGKLGPQAKPAVPQLAMALNDRHGPVRFAAVTALARIGPDAKAALPALVQRMKQRACNQESHRRFLTHPRRWQRSVVPNRSSYAGHSLAAGTGQSEYGWLGHDGTGCPDRSSGSHQDTSAPRTFHTGYRPEAPKNLRRTSPGRPEGKIRSAGLDFDHVGSRQRKALPDLE